MSHSARRRRRVRAQGTKLNYTALIAKAVVDAPVPSLVNASIDGDNIVTRRTSTSESPAWTRADRAVIKTGREELVGLSRASGPGGARPLEGAGPDEVQGGSSRSQPRHFARLRRR